MPMTLDAQEAALVHKILAAYLSDLRMEISGTDSYSLRQELKHDEERIKALLVRLQAAGASTVARSG